MDTPICDFVRRYCESGTLRLHMPGHKGTGFLGCEHLDITEISGADSLYEAQGIIRKSEENASRLFGCPTFYSTEGSSQCIRAMVYLAALHAKALGKRPRIAAARNVHKTFLSAAALLQLQVDWLYGKESEGYLSCRITPDDVLALDADVTALYITSPDYLGNMADISALSAACHEKGILLLVDNAHGAYLRFLPERLHPMDLGADLCCDSAHKTLPVLTGGAYLHIRHSMLAEQAKNALALFGSTSPSYLILQSLDGANRYLAAAYPQALDPFLPAVAALKQALTDHGYSLIGNEPMKLTVAPKSYGYTGTALAEILRNSGIECEFADPDFLVLMLTPAITEADISRLKDVLTSLPRRTPITANPPSLSRPEQVYSIHRALLSPAQTLPVDQCNGRILSAATVGCPPAVPIVVCGERIDECAIACFRYYGVETCSVIVE